MSDPLHTALAAAVRHRGLLSQDKTDRLIGYLAERGLTTHNQIKSWLAGTSGLAADLVRGLKACLGVDVHVGAGKLGAWQPMVVLTESTTGGSLLATDGERWSVIKTLGAGRGNEFRQRFAREIEIMRGLDHPNMVQYFDHGELGEQQLYLVIEFVDLPSLADLAGDGLEPRLALTIIRGIASVVDAMDRHGLVHRDIKPQNILADASGAALLGDFGAARSTSSDRTDLTTPGSILGSMQYISPEQSQGDSNLDVRSDIFSLGCVLHFACTGREPYQGRIPDIIKARHEGLVPSVRALRPELPAAIDEILKRAMARQPDDRFRSAGEMCRALDEALVPLGGALVPQVAIDDDDAIAEQTRSVARSVTASFARAPTAPTEAVPPQPATVTSASGDLTAAATGDWLCLERVDGPGQVMLWARERIHAGKLCEQPIDFCVRNYPVEECLRDCAKVSRRHLELRYDSASKAAVMSDLGSANGTQLGSSRLMPNAPVPLGPGIDYRLVLAGVVALTIQAHARRGEVVTDLPGSGLSAAGASLGLSQALALDSITIRRPDNTPDRAAALVLRRLSIGGADADLPLVGAAPGGLVDIARFGDRWLVRQTAVDSAWSALVVGDEIPIGGQRYRVNQGSYQHFS